MGPYVLNISVKCCLFTFLVNLLTWIFVKGEGDLLRWPSDLGDRDRERDPDRDRERDFAERDLELDEGDLERDFDLDEPDDESDDEADDDDEDLEWDADDDRLAEGDRDLERDRLEERSRRRRSKLFGMSSINIRRRQLIISEFLE